MDYASLSRIGGREINEDALSVCETEGNYCFVVADGLGGHGRGEEASALVVNNIMKYFLEIDHTVQCIDAAIQYAQQELLKEQNKKSAYFEMKTTVVVLIVEQSGVAKWGYVGDSRLYMLRKNRIKMQTQDHSVPQMLMLAGDIQPEEIRFHPDRNKLLRVMGVHWSRPMYDVSKPIKLRKKQSFLLCTDGFWEWIDEKQICACKKESNSPQQWLEHMKTIIEQNGAPTEKEMDNYSAIAVFW